MTLNIENLHLDENIKKGILVEAKKDSFLSKFGVQDPVDLTAGGLLEFHSYQGGQVVSEGEAKAPSQFGTRVSKVDTTMLLGQRRISRQALLQSEAQSVDVIKATTETIARGFGRDVDVLATFGVSPSNGQKAVDITKAIVNDEAKTTIVGENPGESLREALIELRTAGKNVTGIATSTGFYWKLGYQKNATTGALDFPQFTVSYGDKVVFDGATIEDFNHISKIGLYDGAEDSNVEFIVGDFSKVAWGIKPLGIELYNTGDPDNTGRDLAGHNEVLVRLEALVQLSILDPDAFVIGKSAE